MQKEDFNDSIEPLWDRTLRRIRELWPLGDPMALKDLVGPDLGDGDRAKVRKKINSCLEGKGGEVSARSRAAELGETYSVLSPKGRRRFLEILTEYDIDNEAVEEAIVLRREAEDPADRQRATLRLRSLLDPPRVQLLRQFNGLQGGVKFLVDLRSELMKWARNDSGLKVLDQDLYRLLASWFDVGFLGLQRITWNTSAALLEKLIKYEAVHEITSWKDLKNRLEDDRRCYAFFHPSMPDEPLIFVEVALVNGISDNIHDLLDEKAPPGDPEKADTAIFYSISNCQPGLAGVSFGNFLIKRVVADLSSSLPNLKTFSTLSPIPGFSNWLREEYESLDLKEDQFQSIRLLVEDAEEHQRLKDFFADENSDNPPEGIPEGFSQTLQHLCAQYLLEAKRGKQARDRVAHFHLTNGAQVKQINWAANLSARGIEQSFGMMVNYVYDVALIEKRHESYSSQGEISTASAVRKLIK